MQSGLYLLSIIIWWLMLVVHRLTKLSVLYKSADSIHPGVFCWFHKVLNSHLNHRYCRIDTRIEAGHSLWHKSQKINSLVRRWLERIYHLPGRLWVAWFNGRCVASRRCLDTLSTELYQSAPVGFVSLPPCHCVPTWAPNCYRFYL